MSVLVYPRLATLLQARNLTSADLARQIESRFGLPVTPRTLQRLTQAPPIQRADLDVAGGRRGRPGGRTRRYLRGRGHARFLGGAGRR